MSSLEERVTELERRLARVVQVGVIEQADYDAARVRVRIGQRLSDWLPWATARAGGDVDWWAPEVGEQVEVRAPNGEMREARVQPAYYSDAVPAPARSPAVRLIRFGNGTEISHDRDADTLSVRTPCDVDLVAEGALVADIGGALDVTAGAAATLAAPSVTIDTPTAEFTGDVNVAGTVAAQVDVKALAISLLTHRHPGDSGGTTGGPQ